ncbi:hypothetical protein H4582DRAFT_283207 [Lactarius indigo]|nr:hypothetical protein H4582DRAFT_283207 [Lactarius indigo]
MMTLSMSLLLSATMPSPPVALVLPLWHLWIRRIRILTSSPLPVQDTFFRVFPSSRAAPLSRYNKPHPSNHAKSPTTREDVAAALLALRAQPRLSSSRPAPPNVWTQLAAETQQQHPPARRSRVVSPSLRNLVLPRTPSPPPRAPLPMTNYPPIIDSDLGHKTAPLAHIAPPRRTPASSPLPPSSPFAEEEEYESSAPTRFHSLSSPKPEHLPVHIPPDNSETEESASLSRDRESKEDNTDSHSITREPFDVLFVIALACSGRYPR